MSPSGIFGIFKYFFFFIICSFKMIKVLHVVVNKIDIIGIRHKVDYLPFLVQDD